MLTNCKLFFFNNNVVSKSNIQMFPVGLLTLLVELLVPRSHFLAEQAHFAELQDLSVHLSTGFVEILSPIK